MDAALRANENSSRRTVLKCAALVAAGFVGAVARSSDQEKHEPAEAREERYACERIGRVFHAPDPTLLAPYA